MGPGEAMAAIAELITTARTPPDTGAPIESVDEELTYLVAIGHARVGAEATARALARTAASRLAPELVVSFEAKLESVLRGEPPEQRCGGAIPTDSELFYPYRVDEWYVGRSRPPWRPAPVTLEERVAELAHDLAHPAANPVDQLHGILDELVAIPPSHAGPLVEGALARVAGVRRLRRAELYAKTARVAEVARRIDLVTRAIDASYADLAYSDEPADVVRWILPVAVRCDLRLQLVEMALATRSVRNSDNHAHRWFEASALDILAAGYMAALGDLDTATPPLLQARRALLEDPQPPNVARYYVAACTALPLAEACEAIMALAPAYAQQVDEGAIALVDALIYGIGLCHDAVGARERRDWLPPTGLPIVLSTEDHDDEPSPIAPHVAAPDPELVAPRLHALDAFLVRIETGRRLRSDVEAPEELTRAYARLMAAWGFARLGNGTRARELASRSCDVLPTANDEIHGYLAAAFAFRVDQAIAGAALLTPLSARLDRRHAALDRVERYKVDRVREVSMILAGHTRVDAIATFSKRQQGAHGAEVAFLIDVPRSERAAAMATLLDIAAAADSGRRRRLLGGVLEAAHELPDPGATLDRAWRQIATIEPPGRAKLYAAALALATARDCRAPVSELASRLVAAVAEMELSDILDVAGHCDAVPGLREQIEARLAVLGATADGQERVQRIARIVAARHVGDAERLRVFGEAHRALQDSPLMDRLELVRALALAYARAPAEFALPRVLGLAKRLQQISDSFGTNSHYCFAVLHYTESIVLAIVGPHAGF